MKPKLLIVTSTFPRWNNDTDPPFVYELAKRLTSVFEVTVHTPHYHGSLTHETMDGMRIYRFRYFHSSLERLAGNQGIMPKLRRNRFYLLLVPFFLTAQFFSLLLLVARNKPNLIHAHWLVPQGLVAAAIKKYFRIPVVITAHGADVFSLRQPVFTFLKRCVAKNTDRIVTVSNALARVLEADIRNKVIKIEIIPMGVDAGLFSPIKRNEGIRKKYDIRGPFLLYVGRLTEKKGVRYLLDSMPMVVSEIPDVKLLIVGHGELEGELKGRVKQLGLQAVVHFAGGIANEQLPQYFATADIFIGPSIRAKDGDTEGFGLTFVEAAMSGCLLIGTKTGGIEEIISHGKTGFLVEPEDTISLAKTIRYALNNLSDIHCMRRAGRSDAIERFDWAKIVAQYSSLLLATLEQG